MKYCRLFAKHFLDLISFNITDTHWVLCLQVQVTVNAPVAPPIRVKLLQAINRNLDSYSYSCLCEHSLTEAWWHIG